MMVFVSKAYSLSLILGTHIIEGKNHHLPLSSDLYTFTMAHAHTHTQRHTLHKFMKESSLAPNNASFIDIVRM